VVEDEGRDVAGMGVAIADEAAALGRLVDGSFEDPEAFLRSTQRQHRFRLDACTAISFRQPE
jgi:hypothetical protein